MDLKTCIYQLTTALDALDKLGYHHSGATLHMVSYDDAVALGANDKTSWFCSMTGRRLISMAIAEKYRYEITMHIDPSTVPASVLQAAEAGNG